MKKEKRIFFLMFIILIVLNYISDVLLGSIEVNLLKRLDRIKLTYVKYWGEYGEENQNSYENKYNFLLVYLHT